MSKTRHNSKTVNLSEHSSMHHLPAGEIPTASLWRILAAWLYDGMLLFAVLLLTSAIYILPQQLAMPVDASNPQNLSVSHFSGPLFYSLLLLISYFFFAWFWTHGGQTLGLKAWSLRVQTMEGRSISWTQALIRYFTAAAPWILALFIYAQLDKTAMLSSQSKYWVLLTGFSGLLWALIDKKNRTLQDIFSASRIVHLPRPKLPQK